MDSMEQHSHARQDSTRARDMHGVKVKPRSVCVSVCVHDASCLLPRTLSLGLSNSSSSTPWLANCDGCSRYEAFTSSP
jgi:hypothetical protein